MKEWKPGFIVTDHDEVLEPSNITEKRIASHIALTLRLIAHRSKVQHKTKNAPAKN